MKKIKLFVFLFIVGCAPAKKERCFWDKEGYRICDKICDAIVFVDSWDGGEDKELCIIKDRTKNEKKQSL